jgi:hypothetical protein
MTPAEAEVGLSAVQIEKLRLKAFGHKPLLKWAPPKPKVKPTRDTSRDLKMTEEELGDGSLGSRQRYQTRHFTAQR